jgi:type VI secretion system secreted protein VgrG
MASPQGIKAGSAVAPAAPDVAKPADEAEAGALSESAAGSRQKGAASSSTASSEATQPPRGPAGKKDPTKKGWIEVELKDQNGKPITGEAWQITAPDGGTFTGTTDEKGVGRLEGIDSGNCKITFPRFDKYSWKRA